MTKEAGVWIYGLDWRSIMVAGKWVPTRIEMNINSKWYLVGIDEDSLVGLIVRI